MIIKIKIELGRDLLMTGNTILIAQNQSKTWGNEDIKTDHWMPIR